MPRHATHTDDEAKRWADHIAEAQAHHAALLAAARPPLPRRVWRAVWRHRAQAVPVLAIAALLAAGVGVRAAHVPAWTVGALGAVALGGYYWLVALGADRPAVAMVRPALAVAYLVASALLAVPAVEAVG